MTMFQLIVGLERIHVSHKGPADKDELKIKRHRRVPVPCVQPGLPNHEATYMSYTAHNWYKLNPAPTF